MNRLGFLVLSILVKYEAVDKLSSMSVHEIAEMEDYGYRENTIYKKIKEFEESGYIGRGLPDGRAVTFYITAEGSRALEKVKEVT